MTLSFVAGRPFVQVLGILQGMASRLMPHAVVTTRPVAMPEFTPGRGAEVLLNGKPWGWMGELHRDVLDKCDLQDAVTMAEVRLPIVEELFEPSKSYTPIPRFPSISRDLNFVLPEAVSWEQLAGTVSESAGSLLLGTSFGGQYRGKQIEADRKSYVITCKFMAADRTLTTEEVDTVVQQVIAACEQKLTAKLRA